MRRHAEKDSKIYIVVYYLSAWELVLPVEFSL